MTMRAAVIDTALTYVKRHGYCDFSADGSFDPGTETQETLTTDDNAPDGVPLYYLKVSAGVMVEMTAPEKAAIDVALLNDFKRDKAREFDLHTLEILARGVEYPGGSDDYYAITPSALTAVQQMKDVGVYPFLIHAIDYTDILTINDLAEANALLLAARNKMVDVLQEGAALLNQIKGAADKAALDAIVDPRP